MELKDFFLYKIKLVIRPKFSRQPIWLPVISLVWRGKPFWWFNTVISRSLDCGTAVMWSDELV